MTSKLHAAFVLGLLAGEHVHGVSGRRTLAQTNAIFDLLTEVAGGELTLIDTPQEIIGLLPEPPLDLAAAAPETIQGMQNELAARMPQLAQGAMRLQREVAAELLKFLT